MSGLGPGNLDGVLDALPQPSAVVLGVWWGQHGVGGGGAGGHPRDRDTGYGEVLQVPPSSLGGARFWFCDDELDQLLVSVKLQVSLSSLGDFSQIASLGDILLSWDKMGRNYYDRPETCSDITRFTHP